MLKQLIASIATASVVALSATSASASPQFTSLEQHVIRQARVCDTRQPQCRYNQEWARDVMAREARAEAFRRQERAAEYERQQRRSCYGRGNACPPSLRQANASFIKSIISIFN